MARLLSATFRNFRTLRDTTVPFRQQTVLVGPNNIGKSSALQALDSALGVGRRSYGFSESDISDGADPAQGFDILLVLIPSEGAAKFTADEHGIYGTHIDVSDTARQRLFLRIVGKVEDDGQFRTHMRFEKGDEADDGPVAVADREYLGFLLLPAVREAGREFYERSGLWAKIGAATEVPDEVVKELEELGLAYGRTVVEKLLGANVRDQLTEAVAGTLAAVLYADQAKPSVSFTLLPHQAADAMREVEVQIATPGQAVGHRVSAQSVGTQSVAVAGLFSAYLDSVKDRLLALGFEEPEAHLHPQATRALARRLLASRSPTILTTHSTAVTDATDPRDVVVLRSKDGSTIAKSVPEGMFTEDDAKDMKRRIAEAGSEFLFARVVLLAEGPSERLAFPVFAESLGYNFDVLGVSITPVEGGSFKHFLKLFGPDALDIPHLTVCDHDKAAIDLITHLTNLGRLPAGVDKSDLPGSRATMRAAGYHYWTKGSFEDVLLAAGAAPQFVEAIDALYPGRLDSLLKNWASSGYSGREDPTFLSRAMHDSVPKPQVARLVAEKMVAANMAVPAEIKDLLDDLAKRAEAEAKPPEPPIEEKAETASVPA